MQLARLAFGVASACNVRCRAKRVKRLNDIVRSPTHGSSPSRLTHMSALATASSLITARCMHALGQARGLVSLPIPTWVRQRRPWLG
jgi:hypothetical protein